MSSPISYMPPDTAESAIEASAAPSEIVDCSFARSMRWVAVTLKASGSLTKKLRCM